MTSTDQDRSHVDLALALLESLERCQLSPEAVTTAVTVLSVERRRHVLAVIEEYGEALALADVADEVAVREGGAPLSELPPERVARVYTSIYHDHLPRLRDAGLVEYDQERDLVAPTWTDTHPRIDPFGPES